MTGPDGERARIVLVCTGNVCRSPLAEAVLRRELADRGLGERRVELASYGTHALVGQPVSDGTAAIARELGVDVGAARARQLTAAALDGAHLVLTATREHRRAVVALAPRLVRRTFTVRELERGLLGSAGSPPPESPDVVSRLGALATAAARGRGRAPTDPRDDDVVDPYGRSAATYAACARQLVPGLVVLAEALAGGAGRAAQ